VGDGDQVGIETDHSEDIKDAAEDEDGVPMLDSVALQIANNVLIELEQSFQSVTAAPLDVHLSHKVNLLLQIVQNSKATKDKLLIFSHRIPTLDYLGKVLKQADIKFERLDGHTAIGKRQDMTKAFNTDGTYDVFLISTRAGGTGFNLHGANRVILFDFSFSPTWEEQAIGRAFRLGQQKPVYVYRFISAGTFEEDLFNQIVFKTQLAYQAVDKRNTKNRAHKLRAFIGAPKQTHLGDLSECNGKDAVLQAVIETMETGNELIHGLDMAEKLKELNQEQLDAAAQAEMQQIITDERMRNDDPEAYRKAQAAKYAVLAAAARPDPVNSILNRPPTFSQAPSTFAPDLSTFAPAPSTFAPAPPTFAPAPSTFAPTPSTFATAPPTFAPAPPATAPVAQMVAPARALSSPMFIPSKARFELPNGPSVQPHGLPDPPSPATAQFTIP
jgi:superfamily II DNA/RNA helicase